MGAMILSRNFAGVIILLRHVCPRLRHQSASERLEACGFRSGSVTEKDVICNWIIVAHQSAREDFRIHFQCRRPNLIPVRRQPAATILDLGYKSVVSNVDLFGKLPLGKPSLLPQILEPESSGEAQLTHLGSAGLLKVRVHLVSSSLGAVM